MSLLYYMLCQLRGSKAIWYAGMAELADAHGSGPCGSDTMRVQVPLSALQSGDHKITAFVMGFSLLSASEFLQTEKWRCAKQ